MKKTTLILLAVLIASLSVRSQLYFGASFGSGTDFKTPGVAGAASLGIDLNHWILAAGFHSQLSSKRPTVYRLSAGRSFDIGEMSSVIITGGVASLDRYYEKGKIIEQSGTWVASIEYSKYLREDANWFVEMTQAGRNNFLTIGLKYFFRGKERFGCAGANVR